GHLRFEQRLPRRLLFARAKSPHADPQRFFTGVWKSGCRRHADFADGGVQDRREIGRPIADVSERYFYDLMQPGRHLRHKPSLRVHKSPETAHWTAIARQAVRRGNPSEHRPRLRTGHPVAQGETWYN